jgi:hypothetical protein
VSGTVLFARAQWLATSVHIGAIRWTARRTERADGGFSMLDVIVDNMPPASDILQVMGVSSARREDALNKGVAHSQPQFGISALQVRWDAIRPFVGVGAVFLLEDRLVLPHTGSMKCHPYVIVSGIPPVCDEARIAMGRPLQLSCRYSFKVGQHGPLPATDSEAYLLSRSRSFVFSRQGSLPQFTRHGVFYSDIYSVSVNALSPASFMNWLPRDDIDAILFLAQRPLTSSPYPPVHP